MEPAEVITNVTFPVHCWAERGEFFTLLAFCWSTAIQITDGFPGRCGSVELPCGFTRGLMKTWQPSRLKSILWGPQLVHIQAKQQMSTLLMVWGMLGWKVFTWETKPNLSGWVHRLGAREMEQWRGREAGRRRRPASGRCPGGCCQLGVIWVQDRTMAFPAGWDSHSFLPYLGLV